MLIGVVEEHNPVAADRRDARSRMAGMKPCASTESMREGPWFAVRWPDARWAGPQIAPLHSQRDKHY